MNKILEIAHITADEFSGGSDVIDYEKRNLGKTWTDYNSEVEYSVRMGYSHCYIGIRLKKNHIVISMMCLELASLFEDSKYARVSWITVREEYRGLGLARAMYFIAMHHLGTIMSGHSQTPGGKRNWEMLARSPGVKIQGVVNLSNSDIKSGRLADKIVSLLKKYQGTLLHAGKHSQYWSFPVKPGKIGLLSSIPGINIYGNGYVTLTASLDR